MRTSKVRRYKGNIRSSEYQTLGQRITWLRAKQKPVMTQKQLSDISGVDISIIINIEKDRNTKVTLKTLNYISHALGCKIFINMRPLHQKQSCYAEGECAPVLPELPAVPPRTQKASVQARVLAAEVLRSGWLAVGQRRRARQHKAISETPGSD
jgi:transcriptional regulator with XRE-family HTH domain